MKQIVWISAFLIGTVFSAVAEIHYATIDEAIARGDVKDVKAHLAANPETANRGKHPKMSPLQMAVLRKQSEIAIVLMDAGADVNLKDGSDRTPLHLAVERRDLSVLQALLSHQARPNERDRVGWTPLHHAAAKDQVDLARALIEGGADPMTLSEGGGTPLHEAAASGGADMVQLLLDHGVDPGVISKTGETALAIAQRRENQAAVEVLQNAAGEK